VNLDGTKAIGANFTFDGKQYDITASKEVIVSGGAVNSPQILELSGIGDPEVLKKAGVEVKVENKGVGVNVQDHTASALSADVKPDVFVIDRLTQQPETVQAMVGEYMTSGTGFFSNVFAVTGFMPFRTLVSEAEFQETIKSIKDVKPSSDFHQKQLDEIIKQLESETSANIQVAFFPLTWTIATKAEHQGVQSNFQRENGEAGITFVVCTEYPVSRGTIHITSSGKCRKKTTIEMEMLIQYRSRRLPRDPTKLWPGLRRQSRLSRRPPLGRWRAQISTPRRLSHRQTHVPTGKRQSREARGGHQSCRGGYHQ
jgi:choline dehydrogenase-like flavoprotein